MRILIVDDESGMHDSYRRCLAPAGNGDGAALDAMAAELFGDVPVSREDTAVFDLTHAMQGLDGIAAVERAIAEGNPYAVAFIDVRMPPGLDGKETAMRIRALDPNINLVIVTGYSDFSPLEISQIGGPGGQDLLHRQAVRNRRSRTQTATALAHRWQADRDLAEARAALAAQVVLLEEQGGRAGRQRDRRRCTWRRTIR